jgi:magnesium transporter
MLFTDCHFSKIEFFSDFTFGFISIPEILVSKRSVLCFIYTKDYIIFIDRDDFVLHHFTKMANTHTYHITSIGTVLYYLLDFIMYKDLEKINSLQQNLVQLELDVLNEKKTNQIREITEYRSRTMQLHHYYVQIEGICGDLTDETRHLMDDESKKLFNMLMRKISLYSHESEQIWEYTSQIREIYQQQLDVHQNTIMKFLTIVTTLFMPLTLIAGWYGMNFKYMPELHWKYGYPMVFILSCLLVIIMCIIFKKKKWW